ncbi:MAG: hypothetical protein FH762_18025 [Firmicutes bacterium]|nr:hypothetical protein [Bacillota bacterium]
MKISCEIDKINTLKKGMKIIVAISDENVKSVMKDIYNFMDRALVIDMQIDPERELEKAKTINHDQRAKIYAILRDIDNYTGQGVEGLKQQLKLEFVRATEHEMFSLSDCSKKLAGDFIEFLIRFCFENGVDLTDHPRDAFENIEDYIRLCLEKKICCICGRPYSGDPHHCDCIGMGHDRKKVDDSEKRKLPLCYEEHHPEIHTIGDIAFMEKYHVVGVK